MTVFSPEELAELSAYDSEVDESQITLEEWLETSSLDKLLSSKKASRYKDYYAKNRDAILEKSRRWQVENAERWQAYQKAYRDSHREERRLYDRVYHAAKRDELVEKSRCYYSENKDAINAKRREKRAADVDAAREREREYRRTHAAEINARRREKYKQKLEKIQNTVDRSVDMSARGEGAL